MIEALILAAGTGSRMGSLTAERPKALVHVAGRPLIDYAIAVCGAVGAERITAVSGYRHPQLAQHLAGTDVRVVENREYRMQNLLSLLAGWSTLTGDVLVVNVDYVFLDRFVDTVAAALADPTLPEVGVFCGRPADAAPDEMKARLDERGALAAMSKTLTDWSLIFSGAFYCRASALARFAAHAHSSLAANGPQRSVVEHVFSSMIGAGEPVGVVDLGGTDWVETDTPEELAAAERYVAQHGRRVIGAG